MLVFSNINRKIMKNTQEEQTQIKEKLDYIGLDLENIPDFINHFEELEFRPSRQCNDKEYTTYQYVPIDKIQILITPTNRLADIKEKYSKAKPLYMYLNSNSEETVEEFATFLEIINTSSIEDVENIAQQQKAFQEKIPTLVKYEKNYLWQIYYSEYSQKYFMLVPSEDSEYESFLYLLKEQINYYKNIDEFNKVPTIYVPIINCVKQYQLLKKDEAIDIEKYLWIFTKDWPSIYEVTDKEGNTTVEIVGQTYVYDKIKSLYKIKLNTKESADKFYKLLKVLFILQTELPMYYNFRTKIGNTGELLFVYEQQEIEFNDLANFIKNQCQNMLKSIKKKNIEINVSNKKLEGMREKEKEYEKEYLDKQKEISTYLEYKKTFIGRVKYFFSKKKKKNNKQDDFEKPNENKEEHTEIIEQEIYGNTIEDLITIATKNNNKTDELKNLNLDIDALTLKLRNLEKKIENAKLYIDEIDSHKKSIFEFWKFSSKDDLLSLNEGTTEEVNIKDNKLKKSFDYVEDFEEIGKKIDICQREILTKEAQDSVYVFDSVISIIINMLKNKKQVPEEKIIDVLDILKQESNKQEQLLFSDDYDIFGNISQDNTKIKILGNVQHREKEKNLYQILNITEKADIHEFKDNIKKIMMLLTKSFNRAKSIIDMPIYKVGAKDEKIDLYGYNIYNINPEKLLANTSENDDKITLFKVNLPQDVPAIYYSNSIYYDNYNKTLPAGMNVSDKVLIDCEKLDFTLKNKNSFSVLKNNENEISVVDVDLFEYDVVAK